MLPEIKLWYPDVPIAQTALLLRRLLPLAAMKRTASTCPDRKSRLRALAERAGENLPEGGEMLYELCCESDPGGFWARRIGDAPIYELFVDSVFCFIPMTLTYREVEKLVDDLESQRPAFIPEESEVAVWVPTMLVVVGRFCSCCRPDWCSGCGPYTHRNYAGWSPSCLNGRAKQTAVERLGLLLRQGRLGNGA